MKMFAQYTWSKHEYFVLPFVFDYWWFCPLQNTGCLKTSLSKMSSEFIWGVMLKSIWQSVIKPPSGGVRVCGNIYTLNCRHVERMCSVKICKLICQSDQRGKGKKKWEWNEKHTHTEPDWSLAKYSHRNLTLADWLRPQSRRFCTWNGARCYFWAVTCWRNPTGRDRRRTLIQAPVLTATHTLNASMESVCMTQVCSPNRKQSSVDVYLCWHVCVY